MAYASQTSSNATERMTATHWKIGMKEIARSRSVLQTASNVIQPKFASRPVIFAMGIGTVMTDRMSWVVRSSAGEKALIMDKG